MIAMNGFCPSKRDIETVLGGSKRLSRPMPAFSYFSYSPVNHSLHPGQKSPSPHRLEVTINSSRRASIICFIRPTFNTVSTCLA
jgi:hypothetical protein